MPRRRTIIKAGGVIGVAGVLGLHLFPFQTHLYDVRLVNYRFERVSVDIYRKAHIPQFVPL